MKTKILSVKKVEIGSVIKLIVTEEAPAQTLTSEIDLASLPKIIRSAEAEEAVHAALRHKATVDEQDQQAAQHEQNRETCRDSIDRLKAILLRARAFQVVREKGAKSGAK